MAQFSYREANVGPGFMIMSGDEMVDWKATAEEASARVVELEAKFGEAARKAEDDELFRSLGFDPDNLPYGKKEATPTRQDIAAWQNELIAAFEESRYNEGLQNLYDDRDAADPETVAYDIASKHIDNWYRHNEMTIQLLRRHAPQWLISYVAAHPIRQLNGKAWA